MNTTTLPLDPAALNLSARAASHAVDSVLDVLALLLAADATGEPPDTAALIQAANEANEQAQTTLRLVLQAGATRPESVPPRPSDADPLRAMAQADTPATRRLLAAVRAAVDAAEVVDAERGNVVAPDAILLPGESRGTAWAETLSGIAQRLKIEVEGPSRARGQE
jgi:hypothetical protein